MKKDKIIQRWQKRQEKRQIKEDRIIFKKFKNIKDEERAIYIIKIKQ